MNLLKFNNRININILVKLDAIAKRRTLSIFLVGVLSLGGCYFVAAFKGMPLPCYHDEFSYLLSADTFAHGRVTNPTHPMWEHFETFHELMKPTYMSKYPPGQGLFLTIGQILFGHPIYGVWLSAAFMCMAICWMLYGWVAPRWALIGGIAGAMQFGIFTYWSQSYWGGAVAAMGGALVFGALPRIFKYQRVRDALLLGLGIAVLANSRPLEGILIGIPVGIMVLPWKIKWERVKTRKFIKKIVLPFSFILLLTFMVTGTYNKTVTGNAFTFPHLLYAKTYSAVPSLILGPLRQSPQYNNKIMASYEQDWTKKYYLQKKSWEGFVKDLRGDTERIFMFFFGFPLAIPSLAIVLLIFLRRRRAWLFIMAAMVLAGTCAAMTCLAKTHYFASLTCVVMLLITAGLRVLSVLKFRDARIGLILVNCLLFVQLVINIMNVFTPTDLSVGRIRESTTDGNLNGFLTRQGLINALLKEGGKHLVIVRYDPQHIIHFEWVYNDADIDHSPVVWAREMDVAKDEELLKYFKDRQVWHVEVGLLDQYSFREFNARYIEAGWADQFDFYKPYSESAIVGYDQAKTFNPSGANGYYARGVAYYRQGSFDQAIADYNKAIVLNPDYAYAYYGLGLIYVKQGNFTQAIFDYTKVIKLKLNYAPAYSARAGVYYYLKEYDNAWADVRKAEELGYTVNPKFINALKKASDEQKIKLKRPSFHFLFFK